MSDEIKRVADWEPGTLDKTRKTLPSNKTPFH